MSSGARIARNSLVNLGAQLIVGVVSFIGMPILVRGLGDAGFGLLAMIWMLVGYFSVLDFGLGQAGIRFLSVTFSEKDDQGANEILRTALVIASIVSVASVGILLGIAPFLKSVFSIPVGLEDDSWKAFLFAVLAVPFVLFQGVWRAVPVALQRFEYVNAIQVVTGFAQWGGAIGIVWAGGGLKGIMALTLLTRVVGTAATYWAAKDAFPAMSLRVRRVSSGVRSKLMSFGGWVMVSQLTSPVVRYLDRVLVAANYTMSAFTYYAVPYEAISRLQVLPSSLAMALFPALSERSGPQDREKAGQMVFTASKILLAFIAPLCISLAFCSRDVLSVWMGGAFADRSASILSVLAVALLFQALAYIPVTALQALGRPDLSAKLYVAEIPVYVALCFILIPRWGLIGAAWAFLLRILIITGAFFFVLLRVLLPWKVKHGQGRAILSIVFTALLYVAGLAVWWSILTAPWARLAALLATLTIYGVVAWRTALRAEERVALTAVLRGRAGR